MIPILTARRRTGGVTPPPPGGGGGGEPSLLKLPWQYRCTGFPRFKNTPSNIVFFEKMWATWFQPFAGTLTDIGWHPRFDWNDKNGYDATVTIGGKIVGGGKIQIEVWRAGSDYLPSQKVGQTLLNAGFTSKYLLQFVSQGTKTPIMDIIPELGGFGNPNIYGMTKYQFWPPTSPIALTPGVYGLLFRQLNPEGGALSIEGDVTGNLGRDVGVGLHGGPVYADDWRFYQPNSDGTWRLRSHSPPMIQLFVDGVWIGNMTTWAGSDGSAGTPAGGMTVFPTVTSSYWIRQNWTQQYDAVAEGIMAAYFTRLSALSSSQPLVFVLKDLSDNTERTASVAAADVMQLSIQNATPVGYVPLTKAFPSTMPLVADRDYQLTVKTSGGGQYQHQYIQDTSFNINHIPQKKAQDRWPQGHSVEASSNGGSSWPQTRNGWGLQAAIKHAA